MLRDDRKSARAAGVVCASEEREEAQRLLFVVALSSLSRTHAATRSLARKPCSSVELAGLFTSSPSIDRVLSLSYLVFFL